VTRAILQKVLNVLQISVRESFAKSGNSAVKGHVSLKTADAMTAMTVPVMINVILQRMNAVKISVHPLTVRTVASARLRTAKRSATVPTVLKPVGTKCVADATAPTWIGVQWPYTIDVTIGETGEVVYGQIYMSNGTTGGSVPEHSEWKAQLGVKKDVTKSEYPVISATWRWVDATFNSSYTGNNHEYMAGFPMDKSGDFAYIYRFSLNNGESWWYCDKGVVGDTPGPNFITSATNYPGHCKSHRNDVRS
jgi:hypothetical protein